MSKGEGGDGVPSSGVPPWLDRGIAIAFLLFLISMAGAATILLVYHGRERVLLIALMAGAALWGLEYLESRYLTSPAPPWNGYLTPALLIIFVTLVIYLPTLNVYFLSDDFGCLRAFHTPSLSQILKMFHTDLAQAVEGESGQEIRPLYALYYMLSYHLWGLNPRGYHLTAICLHILNSLMVFRIAKEIAPGNSWRAGFAGLLFAVQPAHSEAVSWIAGSPAEEFPTLFYLGAFLFFMLFRAMNKARYLAMSVIAFSACLCSKEIAVTLPVMLVSYDLFRESGGAKAISGSAGAAPRQPRLRFLAAYVPFALLLLGYLEWRRIVFSHFLGEDFWESPWGGHSPALKLAHLARYLGGQHAFNLRQLLLPFLPLALGLALGVYMVWALRLVQRRSEDRGTLAVVLYVGLVWYLISDIPLLVTSFEARHLYLVAVGPCIAAACLAAPAHLDHWKNARYVRFLGAALLVSISACQVWKDNAQFVRRGKVSAKGAAQMVEMVGAMPKQTLVIVQFREEEFLPFALQEPFTSTDLYSRVRIIEFADMCDCPLPQWRAKTKQMLGAELAGAPEVPMKINLLAWNEQSHSLEQRERVLSKGLVQACVTRSLGGPVSSLDSVGGAAADKLVEALGRLVLQGG